MADREKILYANVDWFTVPDELDETDFPEEITNARQMWENNSQKSLPGSPFDFQSATGR